MSIQRPPQIRLYDEEEGVDLFAGGGGTSTGIEMATGRSPLVAINHNAEALGMHEENHPRTEHLQGDVFHYDPDTVALTYNHGRRFAFAWFSPDCTTHSKAKGGVPFRDRRKALRMRGLAWVMARWAESTTAKPRILFMENVEEWWDWGPLMQVGPSEWKADPDRRGEYRKRLIRRIERAGFVWQVRELRASDFGAPTARKRLVFIARCDGLPIVWPEPTHGPGRSRPHRGAYEHIDFSLPVPSIFLTKDEAKAWGEAHGVPPPKRPLVDATLRRVARGVMRYVVESADPFLVRIAHGEQDSTGKRRGRGEHSVYDQVPTLTGSNEFALVSATLRRALDEDGYLVAPSLINTRNGERHGRHGEQAPRVHDIRGLYPTITARGSQGALVAAFLAKHNGGHEATGQRLTRPADTIVCRENKALVAAHLVRFNTERSAGSVRGQELAEPISTLDTSNRFGLVATNLIHLRGSVDDHLNTAQDVRDPIPALTAQGTHVAMVAAFLVKYFGTGVSRSLWSPAGTLTTKDRLALVTVTIDGETYVLVDIGMRMLTPRELFLLQGFPSHYVIDRAIVDGTPKRFTKATQTRLVGNSVPPHLAAAIIRANLSTRSEAVA